RRQRYICLPPDKRDYAISAAVATTRPTEPDAMLDWIANPDIWASLLTLTFLEIVLGIDNIIFLSIITERVAENRRILAQRLGLGLALFGRLALLAGLVWLTRL